MSIARTRPLLALALALLVGPLACGGGDSSKTRSSIAKAFENTDPKAAAEQASEDMKRLKERTAKKAEEEVVQAIDAAAIDDGEGNDLKAACAGMRDAYDRFVQKRIAHDPVELDRWNAFKPMDLDPAQEACMSGKNIAVARCQRHAFDAAPVVVTRGRIAEIQERCVAKYGSQLGARAQATEDRAG